MTETATAADFGLDEAGAVVVRRKSGPKSVEARQHAAEQMRRLNANPEFTARRRARHTERMRHLYSDPEWLARRGAAIRAGHARKRAALGRDAKIIARRVLGETMVAIAAEFGISKQRVHQICTRAASSPRGADTAGPAAADGGAGDSQGRA